MSAIEILSVASEMFPLVRIGTSGDVVGALPAALASHDIEVCTLLPGYPAVLAALTEAESVHSFETLFGGRARLLSATAAGAELLVVEAPHLYARPGNPYVDAAGADWQDNVFRFAALCRVAADVGGGLLERYRPRLLHCHDWQAGLTAAYLACAGLPRPGLVVSVHDLAFQGLFPARHLADLGLPPASFGVDGVEFHGQIGFLKAGLRLADRITTSSPTYWREICTAAAGMGLDGLLRSRAADTTTILDGIDIGVWNPAADAGLAQPFNAARLGGRPENKRILRERVGLGSEPEVLLVAVMAEPEKRCGLDVLLDALPQVMSAGVQLALVGSPGDRLEREFRVAAKAYSRRIGCAFDADERLAHLVYGGADAMLAPALYEPSGAAPKRALRYGAVPVVTRVGGLADSVIDANEAALAMGVATGIEFAPGDPMALSQAVRRAAALFAEPEVWQTMQRNGMKADVSWRRPAHRYAALYRDLVAARAPRSASHPPRIDPP